MAQFTIYRSTDTSAPVLDSNGSSTNMINLLHKILVAGYGSKAGAGWSEPFTNTSSKGVWKTGSGNGFYLRVLDDGTLTGGQRNTQSNGYLSMSDIDTGTNQFPSAIQESTNGTHCNWRKSTDISATARPWIAFADDRTIYLLVQTGDTGATSGNYPLYGFGEFYSYIPNDLYNCFIIGINTQATTASFTTGTTWAGDIVCANLQAAAQASHFKARQSTGLGASTQFYKKGGNHLSASSMASTVALLGAIAYLNTSDGDLWTHPIWVMDGVSGASNVPDAIHGELRGLLHQLHPISNYTDQDLAHGDTTDTLTGRDYIFFKQTPNAGVWSFETSNTLRTN